MNNYTDVDCLLNTVARHCVDSADSKRLCIDMLESAFYTASQTLGFSHARFTIATGHIAAGIANRPVYPATDTAFYALNFDNFPSAWRHEYERKKYWQRDPLLTVALNNGKSTFIDSWRNAASHCRMRDTKIFQLAAQHGLRSGLLLTYVSGNRRNIISFASQEDEAVLDRRLATSAVKNKALNIMLLMSTAVEKLSHCPRCIVRARRAGQREVTLTKAQKAILLSYLNSCNATQPDIAAQRCISADTVKYHLKCIREKFSMPGASGHVLAHHAQEKHMI